MLENFFPLIFLHENNEFYFLQQSQMLAMFVLQAFLIN